MKKLSFVVVLLIAILSSVAASGSSEALQALEQSIPISEIQGLTEESPFRNETLDSVVGVVTAVVPSQGFYLQEPDFQSADGIAAIDADIPAGLDAASQAIFAISLKDTGVQVGDVVQISGKVIEDYLRGKSAGDQSLTRIRVRGDIIVLKTGSEDWSVEPRLIGQGGLIPPDKVIYPDGFEFYENLEGMLIAMNQPAAVASTHTGYGEVAMAPDRGMYMSGRNARGGITITDGDDNPEVLLIDLIELPNPFTLGDVQLPLVGDYYDGTVVGVLNYTFGTWKLVPTQALPPLVVANLPREESDLMAGEVPGDLAFATFNLYNLSGASEQIHFDDLAETIVLGLNAPAIVAVQEVQDDNGDRIDDGTVSAEFTFTRLTDAIVAAGGPQYRWIAFEPVNNADGGAPGGNIRAGMLYNPTVVTPDGPAMRLDGGDRAFANSRKPVAQWYTINSSSTRFLALSLHLMSKSGDSSPWGTTQPVNFASEEARVRQTRVIVDQLNAIAVSELGSGATAADLPLIIGGDMNEYYFRAPLRVFQEARLLNAGEEALPLVELYSYTYQHNSQALDHIFVSPGLLELFSYEIDYVHRYAEYLYGERQSDHDPVLILLTPIQ